MDDNIAKIKDKVDIVDLVQSYVKLQKAGVNYKAPCPFHHEKSGSFFVSPERQIWHCFGCGLGGDIFGFVKQIEGVEFPEALRILAARAGVELSRFKPNPEFVNAKTRLYEINELASKFFGKQLHESATGHKALAYLKDRGLTDESIGKFRLGYAPESWDGLGNFLARTYELKEIFDAGLLVKKEQGGYYDRFRSRIMFPIFDLSGQTVGFAGRIFEHEQRKTNNENSSEPAKYVNTPQTAIYDKSRVLYGLNFARLDLRKKDRCLVVEGNMDVIMSHQAGATHTVASSGTALTDGHLSILKRYSENLDLCFDADSAGSMATDRGVTLALARGFNVGILAIDEPGIKDAADYVKAHGEAWAEYAQKAKPFMEFYFTKMRTSLDLASALGKKMFSQKLLPLIASLANNIEKAHWVGEVASVLKVNEDTIRAELAMVKPASQVPSADRSSVAVSGTDTVHESAPADTKLDLHEEGLLSLILKKPSLASSLTDQDREHFSPQLKLLLASKPDLGNMNIQVASLKAEEYWKDFGDALLDEEFRNLLNHLKKRKILSQLENLEYDIKLAEKDGQRERLASLVAEFTELSGKL